MPLEVQTPSGLSLWSGCILSAFCSLTEWIGSLWWWLIPSKTTQSAPNKFLVIFYSHLGRALFLSTPCQPERMFPQTTMSWRLKSFGANITNFGMEPNGLSPVEGAGPRQGALRRPSCWRDPELWEIPKIVGNTIFATETWSKKKKQWWWQGDDVFVVIGAN